MKIRNLIFLVLFPMAAFSQTAHVFQIIPKPVAVLPKEGTFTLTAKTKVFSPKNDPGWAVAAEYLTLSLAPATGYKLPAQAYNKAPKSPDENGIYLIRDEEIQHPEGYRLEVSPVNTVIRARTAAGAFYAVQTLRQILPVEIFSQEKVSMSGGWVVPACYIQDEPRFTYRGMHLDVGRHFYPVSFVKKFIDVIASQKINTFHWHLTEDQGWRIEIKKYPRLQTVAACREGTLVGHYSDSPQRFDSIRYCGIYTQDEVREVVEYAQKRFVTVIPEIEMPGHALAALSAYPNLGCTGGPYKAQQKWGVFDDVFCAGNDETFQFIEGVLEEVCSLFPGPYVHIGGDECPKTRWEVCQKCQQRMKDNGLRDTHELQSYFIRRAEAILARHGKKLIGWDEILEGGLAPTATVMSWRGTEGGIAAARAGHDAIMTPTSAVYFDYYQGDPATEPLAIGGYLPVDKVYAYDPVPAGFTADEAKRILGVQGNIWTEYIKTESKLEYMAFPRTCALAEIAWSPVARKDFSDFSRRMITHFRRLDALKVNYSRAIFDVNASYTDGKVSLSVGLPDFEIRYTTDGTEPGGSSARYRGPFELTKSATIRAAAFQRTKQAGATRTVQYMVHKASGKPYTMSHQPEKYTGGEQYGLTNGVVGAPKAWNNWVAQEGYDMDPVIDLGAETDFSRITTHFANAKVAWIYPPREIVVSVSDNGTDFREVALRKFNSDEMQGISVETVELETPGARGRYIKFVGTNFGKIPADAPGGGNGAWLFFDEIIVE